ncbi:hypothetical protein [Rhodoferax sp.]|uniref:hypothetical protein n=1 Tax=Rhodoferax sp. TaxID=50421 RepID=UPI00344D8805|nr:hypothetical protein [Rhodoferax sp.]
MCSAKADPITDFLTTHHNHEVWSAHRRHDRHCARQNNPQEPLQPPLGRIGKSEAGAGQM